MRRALTIIEKRRSGRTIPTLPRRKQSGPRHQPQHRLQEAEALYRRSLAIREARFGADHPSVAVALDNLGALLHQNSRFAEAEPLARRSLAIRERSLGPTHPLIGNSLNNLASILDNLERHDEAASAAQASARGARGRLGCSSSRGRHQLAQLGLALSRSQSNGMRLTLPSSVPAPSGSRAGATGSVASEEDQSVEMRNNADPFLGLVVAAYHAAQQQTEAALRLRAEAFESAAMGHGHGRRFGYRANVGAPGGCRRWPCRAGARAPGPCRGGPSGRSGADRGGVAARAGAKFRLRKQELVQRIAGSSMRLKAIDATPWRSAFPNTPL